MPTAAVALAYKQLCWIERLWRDLKDVMEARPIFHHLKKDNVRGHIFVCFLALYLAAELKRRLKAATLTLPWDDVIRDLTAVRAIEATVGGERLPAPLPAERLRRQGARRGRRQGAARGAAPRSHHVACPRVPFPAECLLPTPAGVSLTC